MKIIRIIGVMIGLAGIAAGILAGYRRRKKRYASGGFQEAAKSGRPVTPPRFYFTENL